MSSRLLTEGKFYSRMFVLNFLDEKPDDYIRSLCEIRNKLQIKTRSKQSTL